MKKAQHEDDTGAEIEKARVNGRVTYDWIDLSFDFA